MKKKFVLVLALVLLVAVSFVGAAPVEVSGAFQAGYTFTFQNSGNTITPTSFEAKASEISVSGDVWTVTFDDIKFTGDKDNKASISIDVAKSLQAAGVDTGDVTATFAIGNSTILGGPTVYTDPNGNGYKVRMNGKYSSALTLGYGSVGSVYFGFSPVTVTTKTPVTTLTQTVIVGATVAPVDGVSFAVAYTNEAENKFGSSATIDTKGAFGGSVTVDVAKLLDTDFALSVSAQDVYYLGQEKNYVLAAVSGGAADVKAYVEYQLFDETSNVIGKVTYSGIKNTSLYAKLTLKNLSDIDTTIDAGASYKLAGVTYALDGSYVVKSEKFSLTPSVKVTF